MTHKVPLVVCITRLVPQKGLHLISHAIKRVEELVSVSCSMSHVVLSKCDCLAISFKPSSQFDFNWFSFFFNGSYFRVLKWSYLGKLQMVGLKENLKGLQNWYWIWDFCLTYCARIHNLYRHDTSYHETWYVCVCVCVCIVTLGVSFLFMLHHLIALYWEWGFLINSLLNYIASLPFVLAKYQDDSRWITVIYKMLKFQGCFWVY